MRAKLFWAALLITGVVGAQSVRNYGTQNTFALTGFPLYGVVITETDGLALPYPMTIRPNTAGNVSATCAGDGISGTSLTLALAAGEFFPCQVIEVNDTNTDDLVIHGFY